jgi:ADP-heptose:LPS heptosyltransferase
MRILIVRLGAMGDIVHALPAAAALRQRFPLARIDWVVDARYAALLDLVPAIDGLFVVAATVGAGPAAAGGGGAAVGAGLRARDSARYFPVGSAGWLQLVRALRREGYEAALDLQGLVKSAALARASGARRVIGFRRSLLREPFAALFYKERVGAPRGGHVIDKNLALLSALGIGTQARTFPLVAGDATVVEAVRREHAETRDGFVLLNPGAAWPNKRWPAERFGALAAAIRERHGLPSVVLWGPGEEGTADDVVKGAGEAAFLAPPTRLPGLLALARSARLVVSGDTGPLHLAAAAGARVVALFGPTNPDRNGPWDPADISVSRFGACECRYKRRCRRARPCIDDIGVEEVARAVDRRLAT